MGSMRGAHDTECATDDNGFVIDCGYDSLFSFYDMGTSDLPALVSGVLTEAGVSNLELAGFSRGTSQILVGLAKNGSSF